MDIYTWFGETERAFLIICTRKKLTPEEERQMKELISDICYDEPFYSVPEFNSICLNERHLVSQVNKIAGPIAIWFGGVWWYNREITSEEMEEIDKNPTVSALLEFYREGTF